MRHVVVLILTAAMLALRETVSPRIMVWGVMPELTAILAAELAFRLPRVESVAWPWGVGLAADLRGTGPAGVLAFTYALAAIVVQGTRRSFFAEGLVARMVASGAVALLHRVALTVSQALGGQPPPFAVFAKEMLVGALYTTAVAAIVLPALDLALRRVLPRTRETT